MDLFQDTIFPLINVFVCNGHTLQNMILPWIKLEKIMVWNHARKQQKLELKLLIPPETLGENP